ncbi:MAG: hypothetical protein OCD76_08960 [Reichenbachiella sp.]
MNQKKHIHLLFIMIILSWSQLAASFSFSDFLKPPGVEDIQDGDICGALVGCDEAQEFLEDCLLDYDKNKCATAIVTPTHSRDCRYLGKAINDDLDEFRDFGVRRELPDLLEQNGLYDNLALIYEIYLETPGFVEYVRNNVRHRRLDRDGASQSAKAHLKNIYYNNDDPDNDLIMHEMHHVWQFMAWGKKNMVNNYCDEFSISQIKPGYPFKLDDGKKFLDYGNEQQAEIIGEFQRLILAGAPDAEGTIEIPCGNTNFLNCEDYTPITITTQNALRNDFYKLFDNIKPTINGTHSFDFEHAYINLWDHVTPTWDFATNGTPTASTGPFTSDGEFIYLSTSSPSLASTAGYVSVLESPTIKVFHHSVSFDYHMFGADMGTLIISIVDGASTTEIWRQTGQAQPYMSNAWRTVTLDLDAYHNKNITLRISVISAGGTRGTVSLDNFNFFIPEGAATPDPVAPVGPAIIATESYTHPDYQWNSYGGGYTSAKVLMKKGTTKTYATKETNMMTSQCKFYGSTYTDVSGDCNYFTVYLD